jgi:hypothetical protein
MDELLGKVTKDQTNLCMSLYNKQQIMPREKLGIYL